MTVPVYAAHAELVLNQLVVELAPGATERSDIEALNNGPDRIFVSIDPREIVDPGKTSQSSRIDPDPEKLGLLVSPSRMILEPGQRKLLRIASIAASSRERIYRVTVKPVVGQLSSDGSGLKVLVGYDVLVVVRPTDPRPQINASRFGNRMLLKNDGNVSVELVDGKDCDPYTKNCEDLPGGRLYVGAEKTIGVRVDGKVSYKLKVGTTLISMQF